MNPSNHNWYDANAARPFPLDDAASGVDDAGVELPDDLLVDLSVAWPIDDPGVPFVSGLTAGNGVASVSVSVIDGSGTARVIAASSAAVVTPYRSVALEEVNESGVSGRVVFGPGVSRTGPSVYRFSTVAQARLAARTVRFFRRAGITALRKKDASGDLSGLLTAVAGSDLTVSVGTRTVQGVEVTGLIIGLATTTTTLDLYSRYAGDCGGRPETGTCEIPPVEFLQTISPDCDGNVNLVFSSPMTYVTTPGLIVVSLGVSLGDVCVSRLPDEDGNLPGFPFDPNNGIDPPPYSPPPTPEPPPAEGVSSSVIDCATLPHCELVGAGQWQILSGSWDEVSEAFPHCPETASASSSTGSASVDPHIKCTSTAVRNIMLWYDCGYDDALGLRAETVVKIDGSGSGGVVLGYYYNGDVNADNYLIVDLDVPANRLRVRRWTGFGYALLVQSGPIALESGKWYRVWGRTTGGLTGPVTVNAGIGPADGNDVLTLNTTTNQFVRTGGKLGVISESCPVGFGYFSVG